MFASVKDLCTFPTCTIYAFGIGLPIDSRLAIMIPVQCLYVTFLRVNSCTNPCEANLLSVAQDHQGSIGVPGMGDGIQFSLTMFYRWILDGPISWTIPYNIYHQHKKS